MIRVFTFLFLMCLNSFNGNAQRINFKPFVQGENISVSIIENPLGLNFNQKQKIIIAGDPSSVNINLSETQVVIIEIQAPLEYDLTIEVSNTGRLSLGNLDTGVTIPFQLRFAYNNTGETNDIARRASAIEVPSGFNTITLPVRRKTSGGPPLPPPTPDHDGYVRPRGSFYLYFYGTFGPAPINAIAGIYSGEVDININYADNAF